MLLRSVEPARASRCPHQAASGTLPRTHEAHEAAGRSRRGSIAPRGQLGDILNRQVGNLPSCCRRGRSAAPAVAAVHRGVPPARHGEGPSLGAAVQVHSDQPPAVGPAMPAILAATALSNKASSTLPTTSALRHPVPPAARGAQPGAMGNSLSATDVIMAAGRIDREHVPADDREWRVFWEAPCTMEVRSRGSGRDRPSPRAKRPAVPGLRCTRRTLGQERRARRAQLLWNARRNSLASPRWFAARSQTICSTIHPADVRQMRYRQPRNLANLLNKVSQRLELGGLPQRPTKLQSRNSALLPPASTAHRRPST